MELVPFRCHLLLFLLSFLRISQSHAYFEFSLVVFVAQSFFSQVMVE